jgi:8-oxo-dGTP pyrophosphatase MutT (NUDIX family)
MRFLSVKKLSVLFHIPDVTPASRRDGYLKPVAVFLQEQGDFLVYAVGNRVVVHPGGGFAHIQAIGDQSGVEVGCPKGHDVVVHLPWRQFLDCHLLSHWFHCTPPNAGWRLALAAAFSVSLLGRQWQFANNIYEALLGRFCMEKSCGAVVYRLEEGKRQYLVLHYEEKHWDFPKGHVEEGESEEQTARREIEEETGISQIEFEQGFREKMSYSFKRDGKDVPKEVVFFIAETKQKQVKLSHEHIGFVWLPYESAKKKLTYAGAKEMLQGAEEKLASLSN